MTGRQRLEQALSPAGSPELGAVIGYTSLFARDHWAAVSSLPWWWQQSPDLDQQVAWHRAVIDCLDQDWFYLPPGPDRATRAGQRVVTAADGVWREDQRDGSRVRLEEPVVGGWSPGDAVASIRPE